MGALLRRRDGYGTATGSKLLRCTFPVTGMIPLNEAPSIRVVSESWQFPRPVESLKRKVTEHQKKKGSLAPQPPKPRPMMTYLFGAKNLKAARNQAGPAFGLDKRAAILLRICLRWYFEQPAGQYLQPAVRDRLGRRQTLVPRAAAPWSKHDRLAALPPKS